MNCKQAYDYSMRYFDGALNDIQNAQLKQHLKSCGNCSHSFKEMESVLTFLENSDIEPPCGFEKEVMNKISALEQARQKRTDRILMFIYGLTALFLLTLSIVVAINLNGVTIFEALRSIGDSISSFSKIMFTIYNIFQVTFNVINSIFSIFIDALVLITRTYYPVLFALLFMAIFVQMIFKNALRQEDRGTK